MIGKYSVGQRIYSLNIQRMIIWIYGSFALESRWSEMWHLCKEFQKHGASDISPEAGSFLWCKEMLTSCVLFLKGLFVFRF